MKKYLKFILLFGIVAMIFSCQNNMSDNMNKDMGNGKVMALDFQSNPTTGFDWEYEIIAGDNAGDVTLRKEEYISSNTNKDLMGAGGHKEYEFVGAKPGDLNIRFIYRRPWKGGETAYDVIYELTIDEKLNITCKSKMKGSIESDKELSFFPDPRFID